MAWRGIIGWIATLLVFLVVSMLLERLRHIGPFTFVRPTGSLAVQCERELSEVWWTPAPLGNDRCLAFPDPAGQADCHTGARFWGFSQLAIDACLSHRFSTAQAEEVLGDGAMVFMGDSMTRYLFKATAQSFGLPEPVMGHHEDCHVSRPKNRTLDFLWLPYPRDLAGEVENWVATLEEQEAADAAFSSRKTGAGGGKPQDANATALARVPPKGSLVVASVCLWHVLWIDSAANFSESMDRFARALAVVQKKRPMDVLLLTCPTVWTNLINGSDSQRKQIKMVPPTLAAYDRVLRGLRVPVLDHAKITRRCGPICSMDGVHSGARLYEAEVQIALNHFERWKMGLKP